MHCMMNRRDVSAWRRRACVSRERPSRVRRRTDCMTAADVHVDGYPTVEAVRWMGSRIEEQTQRPAAYPRLSRRAAGSRSRHGGSDALRRARHDAREFRVRSTIRSPRRGVWSLPYVFDSVAAHAPRSRWRAGPTVLKAFETARPGRPRDLRCRLALVLQRAPSGPRAGRSARTQDPRAAVGYFLELVRALGAQSDAAAVSAKSTRRCRRT